MTEHRGKTVIPLVSGDFIAKANLRGNDIGGAFNGNINNADLYQLGIVDEPLSTSGSADLTFETNQKDKIYLDGQIGNMTIADRKSNYTTSGMTVNLLSTADTTHATIAGGDFLLKADAQGTYTRTLNALGAIAKELKSQIKNKEINQSALKAKLPAGKCNT